MSGSTETGGISTGLVTTTDRPVISGRHGVQGRVQGHVLVLTGTAGREVLGLFATEAGSDAVPAIGDEICLTQD